MSPTDDSWAAERLVRVETKLDILSDQIRVRHAGDDERTRAHEDRTRRLETAMAEIRVRVALMSSVIGTAAGVISAVVVKLVEGP